MNNTTRQRYIAAIDLGSNSFHMVIVEEGPSGNLRIIDRVKEMVRLGAGLDENGFLRTEAEESALQCLLRFKQRLKDIPDHRIRAVGTNTLRAAKNGDLFQAKAESVLGHPISVISGHEEARLVYLGAAFDLASGGKQRLVIDIGGGSTELIIGKGDSPIHLDSLYMGCVSLTQQFFADGTITRDGMRRARQIVLREIEPIINVYRSLGWQQAVGTSGTIKAIDRVCNSLGMGQDWISWDGLVKVRKWLLKMATVENLEFVSEQRRPVFPGGFVILETIFEHLKIDRMDISTGALREGVAYDLSGRLHNEDSRFQGVKSMLNRFHTDAGQAKRVQQLALDFLDQVKSSWNLENPVDRKLIIWSSQLHEIGISVSYSQYHHHGAYIVEHSDIEGFSRQVQRVLGLLVHNHRQKITLNQIDLLPVNWSKRTLRLVILLRLAIAFLRGRSDLTDDRFNLFCRHQKIRIELSKKWVDDHPLTLFDLQTEREYLAAIDFDLDIHLT